MSFRMQRPGGARICIRLMVRFHLSAPPGMLGTYMLGTSLLRYKRVPHGFFASPMGGGQRQQAMPSMPAYLPA